MSAQLRLLDLPVIGLYAYPVEEVNKLLTEWEHKLGECHRPFHQEGWALELQGQPVAVAMSASIVSEHVRDETGLEWKCGQLVELARCAAAVPWANRVMLRLWREGCAQAWPCWPVEAAVSYSHDGMHTGDLYRFDGWTVWQRGAGSSGGGLGRESATPPTR